MSAAGPRAGTWLLTIGAMSLVLGLSSAAVLPLLCAWSGLTTLTLATLTLALLPPSGFEVARRFRRAVRPPRLWLVSAGVALGSAVLQVPLFDMYRGTVRVLNHGDEPVALWVDGRRVARVEPSSGESSLAGVELVTPAGPRELRVVSERDGRELFRGQELVEGGRQHLFAPLSAGYCFSIERRAYGAASSEPSQTQPLTGANPFWAVPDGIAWFTPNPESGPVRTSGGTLACLRQRRCSN